MANGKQIYLRSQQIDENGFLRTLAGVAIKAAPDIVRSGGLINETNQTGNNHNDHDYYQKKK